MFHLETILTLTQYNQIRASRVVHVVHFTRVQPAIFYLDIPNDQVRVTVEAFIDTHAPRP